MTELPEGYNPADNTVTIPLQDYLVMRDYPISLDSLELMANKHLKNEALELWQELFDGGLNPMVAGIRNAGCFFGCGAILPEDHKPGCIYLRAKRLIEGDDNAS